MTFQAAKPRALGMWAFLMLLIALMAVTGCSSIAVNYDYDNQFAWRDFKTYAWLRATHPAPENATTARLSGGLLDNRIRDAVDAELEARNIVADNENPDILVKYYLGTQDKVQVTDWGYRYSDYYWGHGGRQIDVYQYTEGTLVIDIIDDESDTLIWRGSATGTVDESQRSPEEMQARINNVVAKIMESFPPK